tara:strand:+ start:11043 stop:11612 length:570 start_codon:yes stop_codon:yes gene_type:complete
MNSKLIVLSAPSGAGKTTIAKKLLEENPKWRFSVSCTTRPRRSQEKNFEDYEFITSAEFLYRKEKGLLLEFEEVHGQMYGTLQSIVDDALNKRRVLVLDMDVNGAMMIKKTYPKESITIFIHPPNFDVLNERLKNRGTDSKEKIKERLKRTSLEVEKSVEFDIEVVNVNIHETVEKISNEIQRINERDK